MNAQYKRRNPEKLKFFLYFLIFMIVFAVVAVFVKYRFLSDKEEVLNVIKNQASVSMAKVEHSATKDGVKEWNLKAVSVNYFQNNKEALFKDINVLFFDKGIPGAVLTAKKGHLNTETNDIVASGDVRVVHDEFTLESESLDFKNGERIIRSKVPVKLFKEGSTITADSMNMDLNTNITKMKGHVEGTFTGTN